MVERKRIAHEALMKNNQKLLFDMLDSFDGPKIIVWDPALIKRFNMEHRVVSMLQLELLPGVPQAEHNHVLYILSGDKSSVKKLVTCLKHAHSDWTELEKCASAILQFEKLSSCLPTFRCKGKWAAQAHDEE
ncbi:unnamed protein product [Gongylonema pulchrum]|uniref:DHC_N2 domain-containing protein n=1 Tax=Gongylonema pulchrum TaxID=637853 RepID=A0A183EDC6_9BILA|nr:unnamed protein product [Gongylonema pulchrum]